MVMEVNSSPGLEGIEKVTGVDVAGRHRTHPNAVARRTACASSAASQQGSLSQTLQRFFGDRAGGEW